MKFDRQVLTGALSLTAVAMIAPRISAQTASNADAVYGGYLRAYLVQSGGSAYFATSVSKRSADYMWNQAEDITGFEDHWYRTHSPATATLVSALLGTFEANNSGENWSWDKYDDDLGWATIAFVRGYEITGNMAFLKVASTNFDTVWSRGWDSDGGGGIWEQVSPGPENQRSVLATGPFIITGAALYTATGDSRYLMEAETAYAWVRASVFNAAGATNSLGAPGHVNEGLTETGALQNSTHIYNEGLVLESAAALYTLTHDTKYLNDAKLVIQYTEKQWPLVDHQSDMFFRGLGNFASQNNLWSTYFPYIKANAVASWNVRRTDYDISNDSFTQQTSPTADLQAMTAMSSLTIQEVAANGFMPPQAVDLTGTYEIQNVASELALTVSEASESEGAAIIQASFVSGATDSLWTFVSSDASGYYRIQNVKSGLDVNVSNASGVIGALMVQQASVQAVPFTDRWLPIHNSDGTFSFCNLATALALDDPRASTAEKTQLDQWYPNGSNAQAFKLIAQVAVGGAGGVGGATDAGGSPGSGAVGSDAGPSGIGGASGTAGAPSVGTGSVGGGAGMSGESSAGNTSTPSVDGGSTANGTKATKGCGCRTAASTSSSRLADALALVVLAAGLFRRRPRIR